MKSLLEQLENNEAILLMYLADELPDSDRAEVEQMLARDPALRRELDDLAALHGEVTGMLNEAEPATAELRRDAVVHRVTSQLERFARDHQKPAAQTRPARRFHIARWLYPVAAAAAILVGFTLWMNHRPPVNIAKEDRFPVPPAVVASPQIFRDEPAGEKLKDIEDEVVRLAAGEEDPLGFRTWNRQ